MMGLLSAPDLTPPLNKVAQRPSHAALHTVILAPRVHATTSALVAAYRACAKLAKSSRLPEALASGTLLEGLIHTQQQQRPP
jgi:hypothetical protein